MRSPASRSLVLFLVLVTAVLSWGQASSSGILEGITYGRGGDTDLKLDLAVPQSGKGPFPALIFLFGGAWTGGSRSQYLNAIKKAAERGYVAATVDYRLLRERVDGRPKYPFPAQLHDVKAAVRWLRANAAKYGINADRIGAVGWSSGGHLALLLGVTRPSDGLDGQSGSPGFSSAVQAVVSVAGIVDLADMYRTSSLQAPLIDLLGGLPEEVPHAYQAASPISYVGKDSPPVLTLQGDQDTTVPPRQAEALDRAMKQAGASHTLIILRGKGHAISWESDGAWEFLDAHLKN